MVNTIFKLLTSIALYALLTLPCYAEDVKVSAGVDQYRVMENLPVKGTIEVTHSKNTPIDPALFNIEGKPIQAELIKEVNIAADGSVIVSIYHFELPQKPKGLHLLPAITLKAGKETYSSVPSTYSVEESEGGQANQPNSSPVSPPPSQGVSHQNVQPYLKLEAKVDGSAPIYPGQHLKFIYRFLYKGDIELTKEDLPLLQTAGFLKIGQRENVDLQEGDLSVSEFSQEVQADKPGTYQFGPSIAEGKTFVVDGSGNRQYLSEVKSEAPIVKVQVLPFPIEGRPASFIGAIGSFALSVQMKNPPEVKVGDKITLAIAIKGKTSNWDTVKLSELCCQPGFTGLFKLGDLPPAGQVNGDVKEFSLDIWPLTDAIQDVPPIEFSYFDPEKKGFTVLRSNQIPIRVIPEPKQGLPSGGDQPQPIPEAQQKEMVEKELHQLATPKPIEIQGNFPLEAADLENLYFTDGWVFLLIPFGLGIIYLQMRLKSSMDKSRNEVKPKTSHQIFMDAMEAYGDPGRFYQYIKQAFITRLFELGLIPSSGISWDDLPEEGASGDVRNFLARIEELRFAGREKADQKSIAEEAKILFKDLQKTM